jgi:putative DNA primase/helicase
MIGLILKDTASRPKGLAPKVASHEVSPLGHIAPFQILDYLDRLNVVKESSSEYHCLCPVCGEGGFKVNKKNGSYQAFKCGCEVKDIRETIRPWKEVTGEQKKQGQQGQYLDIPIKLARLNSSAKDVPQAESNTIPEWLQNQGVPSNATQTRYWYSKTQWVSRFEWTNADGTREKTIRQGHIKSNGLIQWKKGSKDWRAYRLGEAIANCRGKWILSVEGEGCVETARAGAIAGITWQGSNWNEKTITADLIALKQGGAAGIVYFPDHDETGEKKAELVLSACESVDFPCLILSPTDVDVWSEMPVKGDITDFVEAHPCLSTDELTKSLESAITQAIANSSRTSHGSLVSSQKLTIEPVEKSEERLRELPNWSQSDLAFWLAEKYRSKLAWNTEKQEWYRYTSRFEWEATCGQALCHSKADYGAQAEGIWSREPIEFVGQLVKSEVKTLAKLIGNSSKKKKPCYSISFINGVTALLKLDLAVRKWREAKGE